MSDKRDDKRVDRDAFEREIGTDLDEETPDKPKGIALHNKILAGLAIGVIAGITVNKSSAAIIRRSYGSWITSRSPWANCFYACC